MTERDTKNRMTNKPFKEMKVTSYTNKVLVSGDLIIGMVCLEQFYVR